MPGPGVALMGTHRPFVARPAARCPAHRFFCLPVLANEGDAYPLGALPIGTLICNLESHPGKGAQYIRAAGASPGEGTAVCSWIWLSADGEESSG